MYVECGADPLLVNTQGRTVLDCLHEQGRRADLHRVIKASIHPDRYCVSRLSGRRSRYKKYNHVIIVICGIGLKYLNI